MLVRAGGIGNFDAAFSPVLDLIGSFRVVATMATVVMFMEEEGADDVQSQADAPHDEHPQRFLHLLHPNEAFHGLKRNAQCQCDQEDAVEEGSQELRTLPAK